ncbi:hypothetical protein, partial [Cellulomonas sp. RIT-PI-Y]|uniref:hypothetical protein n=1 Tax=Cellulomonas sp. RIT-PI-Y TaxID=3035297 RepID=UPI0021DB1196
MAQQRPGTSPGGARRGSTGTTVGGRYRLVRPLVPDVPGAEPWSATDTILDRPVRVDLLTGPRTAAALDAARRAALVTEPRLARILQVTQDGDLGIIVTGEVEGRSLADLAAAGPLAPDQARAVVGEVAGALEEARRRGLHHLALRPRSIVITPAGRVTLRGLAVEGALLGLADTRAHAASRRDAIDLIRVLYAALTGRWPAPPTTTGALPTFAEWQTPGADDPLTEPDPGLPAAPTLGTASAPPTEVVPGVPADLDTLCAVTLGPHEDGPHSPGEVVRELEPWRPVHAQELFHAADAGRWPSVTSASGGPGRSGAGGAGPVGARPTGASSGGAGGSAGSIGAAGAAGSIAAGVGATAAATGAAATGADDAPTTETAPGRPSDPPAAGEPDLSRSDPAPAETAPTTDSPSDAQEPPASPAGAPSAPADSAGSTGGATVPAAPPGWSWPVADAAPSAPSGGTPAGAPSSARSWPSLRSTAGPTDGSTITPRPAQAAGDDPTDAATGADAVPTETATPPAASTTEPAPAEPAQAVATPTNPTPAEPTHTASAPTEPMP